METDYRRFRRHMFSNEGRHWSLTCGSVVERPLSYILEDPTDVETIIWSADFCAISAVKTVAPRLQQQQRRSLRVLTMIPDAANPGFARLLERNASSDFYRWPIIIDRWSKTHDGRYEKYSKGPSIRSVTYIRGTLTRLIDRHRPLRMCFDWSRTEGRWNVWFES